MKKLLLSGIVAMCCIATVTPAFAAIGIKAGLVRANQNYNYTENITLDPKDITGFRAGVSFQFISLPFVGLLAEAHYVQKGMKIDFIDAIGPEPANTEVKNQINYFSIPALAKVSLGGLYAIAGVRFDILLNKDVNQGLDDSQGFENIYDNFETFVTGYDAGVGFELSLLPAITPLIELRYSGDFKDSYKTDTLSINNKSFSLLIGVMF